MKIAAIESHSVAEELGLCVGDDVLSINGNPVRDILDFRFLVTDEDLEMEVLKSGETVIYELEKDCDDDLGLSFEEIKIRYCGNDCPFCFVDQNPAGMRASMYFRDEDFRLSFLSGHYVTLTNISKRDLDRIVAQQLSPIFVSVHATEPDVRKFLLGINHDDHLLPRLEFLTGRGIEIHTQIVLCPQINDGAVLKKTVDDLASFRPNLASVSIVPLGLTRHREGLTKLHPVTPDIAGQYLSTIEGYANEFRAAGGENFVYASDEFYLMLGKSLPDPETYDGFPQKENGVGMVRFMLEEFEAQESEMPDRLAAPFEATFVTATLASRMFRENILARLNQVANFSGQLAVVENDFYGTSVHVTGLLTGQDIHRHLSQMDGLGQEVFLPANCLKDGAIFLDDWTVDQLSAKLGCRVTPIANDFLSIFERRV